MTQGTGRAEAGSPGRPACIGWKSGSSLVWQPTDLTVWGTRVRPEGPCLSSFWGFLPALWTPGEAQAPAKGPGQEGVGRLGRRGELLAKVLG